jgi:hypothetical protein
MAKRVLNIGVVFFFAALLLYGCNLFRAEVLGTLEIKINERVSAMTIEPSTEMVIDSYEIVLVGPSGTINQTAASTDTSVTVSNLISGDWTITVNALNAADDVIATDTTVVTVLSGQTSAANITVIPLTGQGPLNLTVSWPDELVASPSISAALIDSSDVSTDISASFSINSTGDPIVGMYSGNWDAGYYTLTIQLLDEDLAVMWGTAETVRIIEGTEPATGAFILTGTDMTLGGEVQINLAVDLQNPVEVTLSGIQSPISTSTEITVTANPSVTPDSYKWFFNGALQAGETGPIITIGPSGVALAEGSFTLSVVVRTATLSGSVSAVFDVSDTLAPMISSVTTGDTDADGQIDEVTVVFDKNVDIADGAAEDGFPQIAVAGYTITNADYAAANTNTLTLTITESGSADSDATPYVTFTNDGDVTDASIARDAADYGPAAAADGAGPAIISAVTVTTTTVDVTFSENVSDASLVAGDFTFFAFATGGANAVATGLSTGTGDDDVLTLTLAAEIGPNETGAVKFTGAGVGEDVVANTNTQTVAIAVTEVVYAIGDTGPAGGIIFCDMGWFTGFGWQYLEAASSDQSTGTAFGGFGEGGSGYGFGIGMGEGNTYGIVTTYGDAEPFEGLTDYAAKLCYDLVLGGYDDWFLPSQDELNLMYQQKEVIGGFTSSQYWSSTEYDRFRAWDQYFNSGIQYYSDKTTRAPVRAIRAF